MNHVMKLKEKPFDKIKAGIKTVEIRLLDEKRKLLQINDTITFLKLPDLKEKVQVKIRGLLMFKTFKELLGIIPLTGLGCPVNYDTAEFINSMYAYYTPEQEKNYGILAIVISNEIQSLAIGFNIPGN
ncbi:ASCH domain-containing protein [Candidatus Woesearchaeota archaeon]|nr:ASCH domain-containing protein [Candidatus Woesearchaeota archaeon]